jgi:hypothetical protein
MRPGVKLLLVAVAVTAAGILIGFYVSNLTTLAGSPAYSPTVSGSTGHPVVNLEIQTVAAVGPQLSRNPNWVSYLVKDQSGQWKRETVWDLPAHATVHVTIYNFDGASGLRNPFLSQVQGTVGGRMRINGKPTDVINPDDASHTFTVPEMGITVPLLGVPDNAKHQCAEMPCSLKQAHETMTFTFRTGKPGRFRWQCFVPCAAGFIDGFAGPMQTIGYMDGFIHVV